MPRKTPDQPIRKRVEKRRIPSPKNTATPTGKTISRTRNRIIGALGISAAGLLFAYQNDRQATEKDTASQTAVTPEIVDRTEIKLGNAHFKLQNPENISPEERAALFANMEKAYAKLKAYFGEEVMTLDRPYDCSLILKPKTKRDLAYGKTQWETRFHLQQGKEVEFDKPTSLALYMWTTEEEYIAHEFVHLYVQPQIMLSEAFFEGHAHAIQGNLYGTNNNKSENRSLMENPVIRRLLDAGFDYNLFERDYLKGGVQTPGLNMFLKTKWEMEWAEFMKADPEFLKKFYTEISKRKKQGKTTFTKNDLLEIAGTSSVNFNDWYKEKTKSMRELGENGSESVVKAVDLLNKNTIVIINVRTLPKQTGQNPVPPRITPALEGKIQAAFLDTASGRTQTSTVAEDAQDFIVVNLEGNMRTTKLQNVTIGGKEIDIEK